MSTRRLATVVAAAFLTTTLAFADLGKDLHLDAPVVEPSAQLAPPSSPLEVTAWTNHESGRTEIGENLEIVMKATADCFVYVVDIGTSGTSRVIFPNRKALDNQVNAGKIRTVPERGTYQVLADGPAGIEHLIVIACTKPLPVFENLHLVAPRKVGGELDLGATGGKGLRVVAGASPQPSPGASPADAPGLDLEPLLSALEQARQVKRGRELAHTVVRLTIADLPAESTEAPPSSSAEASPAASAGPVASPAGVPATAGRLTIDVTPAGRIYVDGTYRGMGRGVARDLIPGEHEVTVIQDGYRTHLEQVTVAAGDDRTIRVQLRKAP